MKNFYLNELLKLKNNFSVKIISGVRGVGKSSLLKMFAEKLGAKEEIIFIDCAADIRLRKFNQLYEFVAERTAELEKFFLLIDDADRVVECEKAINALFVGAPAEIYLTCSSDTFAEKISALLPDNCDVLRMYPPSFAEYKTHFPTAEALQDFLHFGGLPVTFGANKHAWQRLLRGAVYEIMFELVEKNSVQQAELLHELMKTLARNVGTAVSLNKLAEELNCTPPTLRTYLNFSAGLFRRIPRFNIKAEKFLSSFEKFYCVDNGLLTSLAEVDKNILIENAVCAELWRRGYEVSSGRFGVMNITFVGERGGEKIFVQVLATSGVSARRAARPLRAMSDDGEKILVTTKPEKKLPGVKILTLQEFLLNF